jgi:hypothetical protein
LYQKEAFVHVFGGIYKYGNLYKTFKSLIWGNNPTLESLVQNFPEIAVTDDFVKIDKLWYPTTEVRDLFTALKESRTRLSG